MNYRQKEVIEAIMLELNHFRFSRTSISYQYLIEAIYLVIENRSSVKNFNKNVYEPISKKYDTKPQNIQWSLSKLISLMYLNTPNSIIFDYFKFYEDERPTLKFFIITIAQNVKDSLAVYR